MVVPRAVRGEAARAPARDGGPAHRPARAAQHPRAELRRTRPAWRRGVRRDPAGPTGEGSRRVATVAPRQHPARTHRGLMTIDVWNTSERVDLRDLARDFTVREIAPNVAQWERDGELPRSLHKKAADAGLLGVAFPEAVGGQGGNSIDSTIV